MTPEECMTTIGTHHVTEDNFWGSVKEFTEKQIARQMTNTNGTLTCPVCGFHQMYEVNYCPKCGQKLHEHEPNEDDSFRCPVCGYRQVHGTCYCPNCGQQLFECGRAVSR